METTVYFSDAEMNVGREPGLVPALLEGIARLVRQCPDCGHFTCTRHNDGGLARFPGLVRGIEAVQRADASRSPWNGCPAVGDRTLEMMFRVECRDRGGAIVRLCVRESTEPRTVPEQEAIPWG